MNLIWRSVNWTVVMTTCFLNLVVLLILYFFYGNPWHCGHQIPLPLPEFIPIHGGLPQQIPDQLTNGENHINFIPAEAELHSMSIVQLSDMYHTYMTNAEILCKRLLRMGNVGNGGYNICNDARFKIKKPCLVYSFGINNDFSFDDFINQTYRCEVHSFDPSMLMKDGTRRAPNMFFHLIGLSNVSGVMAKTRWPMRDLHSIKKILGHPNTILDILKMDIENFEWQSLSNIVATEEIAAVRQLIVEFHVMDSDESSFTTKDTYIFRLKVVGQLQRAGLRVVYAERNAEHGYYSKRSEEMRSIYHSVVMVNIRNTNNQGLL